MHIMNQEIKGQQEMFELPRIKKAMSEEEKLHRGIWAVVHGFFLCGGIVFPLLWLIYAYMLPCMIAAHRKHHSTNPICVLNILLGWTFLAWVIALIWAVGVVKETKQ